MLNAGSGSDSDHDQQVRREGGTQRSVIFDLSKNELFTPTNGYKVVHRKIKAKHSVVMNTGEITHDLLSTASLIIFAGPREKLSMSEKEALQSFIDEGNGSVLMLGFDGSNLQNNTYFNDFIGAYGIECNQDGVARHIFQRYFHPKQVLINDPTLSDKLEKMSGKKEGRLSVEHQLEPSFNISEGFSIVYPFGCTLEFERPAIPILQSGSLSFPAHRPLAVVHRPSTRAGTILVVGSVSMFSDDYIDKENNDSIFTSCLKLLLEHVDVPNPDRDYVELGEQIACPNTAALAEHLHTCLQESEELPQNFTALFDDKLFELTVDLIPEAVTLGATLSIPSGPLTLIPPEFDIPQPKLQPAVFPPCFREIAPPPLELFDLDDHFATRKIRLAQLCNRCDEGDLEWFVKEAGEICGIAQPQQGAMSPNQIILSVLQQLVEYKKCPATS